MFGTKGLLSKAPFKVGKIFREDFTGNLSNYVVNNGAGGILINASDQLVMSGASGGITSNIQFNNTSSPHQYTCLEKWKQRVTFIGQTATAGSFGFSIGTFSQNNFGTVHNYARLAQDGNASNVGKFYTYSNVNGSASQTTNGSYALVNGTTYIFEVERNKNTITARLFAADGVTQLRSEYSSSYNITTNNFSSLCGNVGRFCLINHGGTNRILKWEVFSDAKRNTDYAGIAASIGVGMFAGSNSTRYLERGFTNAGKSFELLCGFDQGMVAFDLYKKEVVRMNPRIAHVNLIGNDIAHSVASGTYQANYAAYIAYLKGNGIKVVHGTPVARTGFNNSVVGTYLDANYPTDQRIDYFTLTKEPANNNLLAEYNIGDGVHPNSTGHSDIGDLLSSSI